MYSPPLKKSPIITHRFCVLPPFEKSPIKSHRFHVLPPLKNHPSKTHRFCVLPPLKKSPIITHRFCVLPPLKNHPSKAIGFHVLPPLKNHPSKAIGFVYSPLWKITHQNSSVLCSPPFEKSLFLMGAYFGWAFILGWALILANTVCWSLRDEGDWASHVYRHSKIPRQNGWSWPARRMLPWCWRTPAFYEKKHFLSLLINKKKTFFIQVVNFFYC